MTSDMMLQTEAAFKGEKSPKKTPTFELSAVTQLPSSTNCLSCSEDSRYLSMGHSRGLSLWCATSLTCVAEWLQDRVEITSIQMSRMAEMSYLLGTIDDMGVARIFAYHSEGIYLLTVINTMETINKRSICLKFELSEGGDYGAVSISCNGAFWLDVYKFPTETWLKELEMEQKQESDSSGILERNWSPVTLILKIKPTRIPSGDVLGNQNEVLQEAHFMRACLALDGDTFGSGQSHDCHLEEQDCKTDQTKERNESQRCCTHHFLLPCGQFPGDNDAKTQTGFPGTICVWWNGSRNLLQYLLPKTPNKKADVEMQPDVLWPNAKAILCSAVSRCTRYIALGLEDALVCIWDRWSGSPMSVVFVSAADSALIRLRFVDSWSVVADASQTFTAATHLLVVCKSGTMCGITTTRETQPCVAQLTERPKDSGCLPAVTASVPFLSGLSLVVQRNGKIFLQDVVNRTPVCFLTPPTTHLLATPCDPVFALNNKQQTLFVRGDSDPISSPKGTCQCDLFMFHFAEVDIIRPYVVSLPESPQQPQTMSFTALDTACDLYLHQRALSADERSTAIMRTWKQLQETAVVLEQRRSSAARHQKCS